jgi:hypothetical protein
MYYRHLFLASAAALIALNTEGFAAPMPYGYGYPSYGGYQHSAYNPQQYSNGGYQHSAYNPQQYSYGGYQHSAPYQQYQQYAQQPQPFNQFAPPPSGPMYGPAPSGKDIYGQYAVASGKGGYVPSPYGGSPSPYGQPPAPIPTVNANQGQDQNSRGGFFSAIRSMFKSPFNVDYESLGGKTESMYSFNNDKKEGLNVKIRRAKNPANRPENQKYLDELDDGLDDELIDDSDLDGDSDSDYDDDFSSCSCNSNVPPIPECVNACKVKSSSSSSSVHV